MVEHPPESFPKNLSWDEFLALPYELRNASLVDGEVIVNPPNHQHQWILGNLYRVLGDWQRAGQGRGMFTQEPPIKINDRRGYMPDFAWYPADQCSWPDGMLELSGIPALVVEVLSPSTRTFDLMTKRADYDKAGIQELWYIDQRPAHFGLQVCQRSAVDEPFVDRLLWPGDRLTSPLLEGFDVDAAALFER